MVVLIRLLVVLIRLLVVLVRLLVVHLIKPLRLKKLIQPPANYKKLRPIPL